MAITRGKTSSIRQGAKNTSMLAGYPPTMAAPTATAGVAAASVAFTAVSGATSYTAISNPGNITATGTSSPISVSGLTPGTAYTFRVSATNSVGTSNYSVASNSVTPISLILVTVAASPYIAAWPFSGSGFGTRYSNPSTSVGSSGNGVAFNRQTSSVAIASSLTPFVSAYPFDTSSGFGTKFANPSTAIQGSDATGVAFNPTGDALGVSVSNVSSPVLQAYRWSSAGWGTKYSNASPDISGSVVTQITFHPDNNVFAAGGNGSPFISAWAWTSTSGFGTQFSQPGNLPPGAQGCAFKPQGDAIGLTYSNATPYVAFYPWSNGFGTRYTAPGTPPPQVAYSLSWHPTGNAVAMGHSNTPFISAWAWSSGFGSKYANPASLPPDTGVGVSFDTGGNNVALAHSTSPNISVYAWSSGFGTKYSNPASLPGANNGSRPLAFL